MDDCNWIANNIINVFQPVITVVYRLLFNHYWLAGFNFAIYKQIYEKSGGFNTKLNAIEDVELAFKVSKIGKIKFIPDLPVTFSGRRFQKGLIKGLIPYLTAFLRHYFQKKEDITLSDVR